ncbi:hypothetical protein I551_0833 [Mycobacterium ulcerans str. Harvey]|uniref:Uncharacterized protein n=1 Tax=Mycobacterium ulcerans str. Harvey TaxID=1299332 RepID=A0ABN0R6E5_MYCUL|nr:hypothetical protein I551_0833 [Mycobacterium ulcerans str. Harvey]
MDYVRMWVQAAAVMGTYQMITQGELLAAPNIAPAPWILVLGGEAAAVVGLAASAAAATPPLAALIALIVAAIETPSIATVLAALVAIVAFPVQAVVFFFSTLLGQFFSWIPVISLSYAQIIIGYFVGFLAAAPVLTSGAEIAVPVSVPLGVGRHLYDVQMANADVAEVERVAERSREVLVSAHHAIAPSRCPIRYRRWLRWMCRRWRQVIRVPARGDLSAPPARGSWRSRAGLPRWLAPRLAMARQCRCCRPLGGRHWLPSRAEARRVRGRSRLGLARVASR